MIFLPQEVDVPIVDPFKNDLFGRKDFANSLIRLFENTPKGPVISLNAKWGEGKTTFTKMWLQEYQNKGGRAVYLNTFEFDYFGDPFLLLASTIYQEFKEQFPQERSTEVKRFQGAAVEMGKHLLAWGVKAGVRAATLNVVDSKSLTDLGDLPEKLIEGATDSLASYVEDKIENFNDEKKGLEQFRDSLSKLGAVVREQSDLPFVIVVDELDRCKPSFAVQAIERIKHFFSVPNVAFFIVMNREQIEEAIKAQYGVGIDAPTYLQKFIDVEATFPKKRERVDHNYQKYVSWATKTLDCNWYQSEQEINRVVVMLAIALGLSFRDIGKVVQHLALLYKSIEENRIQMTDVFVALCTLKVKFPQIFDEVRRESITLEKAMVKSGIYEALGASDEYSFERFKRRVVVLSMTNEEMGKLDKGDSRVKIADAIFPRYNVHSPEKLPAAMCEWIEAFDFIAN